MKSRSKVTFFLTTIGLFWVLAAEGVSAQVLEVVNEHYLIEASVLSRQLLSPQVLYSERDEA